MTPVRLWLVRHGEPSAGFGEHLDPGLSPAGLGQAEAAAARLLPLGPRALATSPLARCRETARPLEARSGLVARVESRVAEVPTPPEARADRSAWLVSQFPSLRGDAAPSAWADAPAWLRSWRADAVAALTETREDTVFFTHFIAINAILSHALGREETIVASPGHAAIISLELASGRLSLVAGDADTSTQLL